MTELKTDWRARGNTFGRMLINGTIQQSQFVSSDEEVKGCFVREFLALCRFGLGIVGSGSPVAYWLLAGIDEELVHYPQFIDVLCVRPSRYHEAFYREPWTADLFRRVVEEWARYVDDSTMVDWLASQEEGDLDSASTV